MRPFNRSPSLYLLTNDDPFAQLKPKLQAALGSGAVGLLQIRRKCHLISSQPASRDALRVEIEHILTIAQRYRVPVLINDDVPLAQEFGVGVHLGQQDGSVAQARACLGAKAIIGSTCHDRPALVASAQAQGASYAAMGAMFASPSKPQASPIDHQAVRQAAWQNDIDLCAIGGINLDNLPALAGLPLTYIAVISDILSQPSAQTAAHCQRWQHALTQHWLVQ